MVAECHYSGGMVKLTVRLPDDVHGRLSAAAERQRRSLNDMVVIVLDDGLPLDRVQPPSPLVVIEQPKDVPQAKKGRCTAHVPYGTKCKLCGETHQRGG